MADYIIGEHARFEMNRRNLSEEIEASPVKVSYDQKTDTLSFILKENVTVAESDEDKPGIILDYDGQGDLVSMEILDASRRVTEAKKIDFKIAG